MEALTTEVDLQKTAETYRYEATTSELPEKAEAPPGLRVVRKPLAPFLKWAGGKRWLVSKYCSLLPKNITGRYIEPFLGSGAVFFFLRPDRSILSDLNADLISTYRAVKNSQCALVKALKAHHHCHQHNPKEYYYVTRENDPGSEVERAARFVYLNRTCFNGLYRVNKKGSFNVPIGSKMQVVRQDDCWKEWGATLRNADLISGDFEVAIDQAKKGDFLFVDPPYTVKHNNNGFIKYNEVLFSWEDQIRLSIAIKKAKARGAKILLTNANHKSIAGLYGKGFKKTPVSRFSALSGKADGRGSYEELVISA